MTPCRNSSLLECHRNALNHIRWGYNYTLNYTEDIDHSNQEHNEIFKAYCAQDSATVERLIRKHIDDVSARVQAAFSQDDRLEKGKAPQSGA